MAKPLVGKVRKDNSNKHPQQHDDFIARKAPEPQAATVDSGRSRDSGKRRALGARMTERQRKLAERDSAVCAIARTNSHTVQQIADQFTLTWRCVYMAPPGNAARVEAKNARSDVMRAMAEDGMTPWEIANQFGSRGGRVRTVLAASGMAVAPREKSNTPEYAAHKAMRKRALNSGLAALSAGVPAVGVPGAGSCNADHVAAVASSGSKRIILAFDNDEAGQKGRERWTRALKRVGTNCFIFGLVKGCKDVNDQIMKHGPKSLGLTVTTGG